MLGPLFRYELTRLARRGLQPRLRALFAGLLLVALLLTYLQSMPGVSPGRALLAADKSMSIGDASRFGERFLIAFLVVQLLVVVVLAPVLAGNALAEEKQRGSLDFLLASPLTSLEIVVGKMLARVVFLGGVVLTGLPILTLTMFFGGVDGGRLLAGYAVTLLTILSLGAFSLSLGVTHDGLREILIWSYATVVGLTLFGCGCGCVFYPGLVSPFSAVIYLLAGGSMVPRLSEDPESVVIGYTAVHLPLTAWFLGRAAYRVRPRLTRPHPDDVPPEAYQAPRSPDRPTLGWVPREHPSEWWALFMPPLGDEQDPFEWKERWFGGRLLPPVSSPTFGLVIAVLLLLAWLLFILLVPATMAALELGRPPGETSGPVARVGMAVLLLLWVLALGVLTTGSVARERERQTLDALLVLPVDRRAILRAKAREAVRRPAPLLIVVGLLVLFAVVTGGASVSGVLAVMILVVGWGAFGVGFGIWLSVRCRTAGRATGYFLGAVLGASIAPPLISPVVQEVLPDRPSGLSELVAATIDGLGPATGARKALTGPEANTWVGFMTPVPTLGAACGASLMGWAGLAFWRSAVRRFATTSG